MDLTSYSPGLFVAPATKGFCEAWMDMKSVPFQCISTQQIMEYSPHQSRSYAWLKMHMILQSSLAFA